MNAGSRVGSSTTDCSYHPRVDQERVLREVVDWATDDPNVRLVVVTGSFARGGHDALSDLDIELYVTDPAPLLEHDAWCQRFGDVLVTESLENPDWHPTRLVYYVDARIDFMIAPVSAVSAGIAYDDRFLVALDKDHLSERLRLEAGVVPPSEEEFRRCVDWFFAAAMQEAKAIARSDPWPAKVRDADLKRQLLQMLEWNEGARRGWTSPPPHDGSRIEKWGFPGLASWLPSCWSDFSVGSATRALARSIDLFNAVAGSVAKTLGYNIDVVPRASAEVERILAVW